MSERRKGSEALNDAQQTRTNLIRVRDWAQAVNGLNSKKANEAEVKVAEAEDEVARVQKWYAALWATEMAEGKEMNELEAEVKALDQAKVRGSSGGRVEVAGWSKGAGPEGFVRTSGLW